MRPRLKYYKITFITILRQNSSKSDVVSVRRETKLNLLYNKHEAFEGRLKHTKKASHSGFKLEVLTEYR